MSIRISLPPVQLLMFILTVPLFSQHGAGVGPERTRCREAAAAVNRTLREHLFDAAQTETAEYRNIEQKVMDLSEQCIDLSSFISGFNALWSSGPFSHVRLNEARMSAEHTAHYLDTMNVPRPGAVLSWKDDVAVLTVYTMMGRNTIAQIGDAYTVVKERRASALIIDLRKNDGGTFAVRPLVGHLLSSDLDAGVFISRRWTERHTKAPTADIQRTLDPWQGWSIRAFWKDVLEQGLLRIVFQPMPPRYDGPVYVLTSRRTASAAELAADALLASGRATIIGDTTAGKMLSQKMFDIPHGLQLSLPVADYITRHSGRIEGRGVAPTVIVPSEYAIDTALVMIKSGRVKHRTTF